MARKISSASETGIGYSNSDRAEPVYRPLTIEVPRPSANSHPRFPATGHRNEAVLYPRTACDECLPSVVRMRNFRSISSDTRQSQNAHSSRAGCSICRGLQEKRLIRINRAMVRFDRRRRRLPLPPSVRRLDPGMALPALARAARPRTRSPRHLPAQTR